MSFIIPLSDEYLMLYGLWMNVIGIGAVTTLFMCFSKRFHNATIYAKHCRFWFKVTALLFFINVGIMLYSPDISHFSRTCSFANVCLFPLLYFVIALIAVTLVLANLQNSSAKDEAE